VELGPYGQVMGGGCGKELRALAGHSNAVDSVAFSPDGKTLASGRRDDTINYGGG